MVFVNNRTKVWVATSPTGLVGYGVIRKVGYEQYVLDTFGRFPIKKFKRLRRAKRFLREHLNK
jgi:hypothetical protein